MNYLVFKRTIAIVLLVNTMVMSAYSMRVARAVRALTRASAPVRTAWKKAAPAKTLKLPRRVALAAVGLYTAYRWSTPDTKSIAIVDVTSPSRPHRLGKVARAAGDDDVDELATSLSQLQFAHDHPVISKVTPTYRERVNRALVTTFGVLSPVVRDTLSDFAVMTARDETLERSRGNITLYSGTAQVVPLLFGTILDEVLNGKSAADRPTLRHENIVKKSESYPNARAYYEETRAEINRKYKPEWVMKGTAFGGAGMVQVEPFHDGAPGMSDHFIAANYGLSGQSTFRYGRYESSLEFMTKPHTVIHYAYLLDPPVLWGVASDIITKRYKGEVNLRDIIDANIKTNIRPGLLLQRIFRDYDCASHYDGYAEELGTMTGNIRAGMLQFSLSKEVADRWCYVSRPHGILATDTPLSELVTHPDFPRYQARIFTPPAVLKDSRIKFYVMGDPEAINHTIERLYEMAYEIKKSRDAEQD